MDDTISSSNDGEKFVEEEKELNRAPAKEEHSEKAEEEKKRPHQQDGDSICEGVQQGEEKEEEDDDLLCYICWEGSSSGEEKNPLRRDCGCSGSTGWVHASCLIELAESRVKISDPLVRPWSACSQCTQPYRDPTKSLLEKALLSGDGRWWLKQVLSGIKSGGAALLLPCLYFGLHSALGCTLSFVLESLVASHNENKLAIYLILAIPIVRYRWRQLARAFLQVATILSIGIVWMIAIDFPVLPSFQDWATILVVGSVVGALWSYQAYRVYQARGVIRHELLQLRRRGIWSALFQVAFIGMLLVLHHRIDHYVFNNYMHLRELGYVDQMVERHYSSSGQWNTIDILEEPIQDEEKLIQQYQAEQFREDYLYWSCCS